MSFEFDFGCEKDAADAAMEELPICELVEISLSDTCKVPFEAMVQGCKHVSVNFSKGVQLQHFVLNPAYLSTTTASAFAAELTKTDIIPNVYEGVDCAPLCEEGREVPYFLDSKHKHEVR